MRLEPPKLVKEGVETLGCLSLETLVRLLPEPSGYRLARFVGGLLRPPPHRKRIVAMMKAVLDKPDWTEARWREMLEAHLRWVGHVTIEIFRGMRLSVDELHRRFLVSGEEHLAEALRAGRGAMLFANHLGNFGSFLAHAARWAPEVCVFMNAMPARIMERRIEAIHRRMNVGRRLVGQGISHQVRGTLQRNGCVVAIIDYTSVKKHNCWVRFGRAETLVNLGPALLALRNGAEALSLIFTPLEDGRHRITIHPPLPRPRSGNPAADAQELTQRAIDLVAGELLQRPEQWWLWDTAQFRDGRNGVES